MKPKRTHLEVASGRFLDFANPEADGITLEDIARGLGNCCRWVGQIPETFSVAEHACLVHDIVRAWGRDDLARAALHHDDHEAYTGDIPTPMKNAMGPAYYLITEALDGAIAEALDLDLRELHHPIVKEADNLALFIEAQEFKPSGGRHWPGRPVPPDEDVELPEGVRWSKGGKPSRYGRLQYLGRELACA